MSATIISTHSLLRQAQSHPTVRRRVRLCRRHGFHARTERKSTVRYAVRPRHHSYIFLRLHQNMASKRHESSKRHCVGSRVGAATSMRCSAVACNQLTRRYRGTCLPTRDAPSTAIQADEGNFFRDLNAFNFSPMTIQILQHAR